MQIKIERTIPISVGQIEEVESLLNTNFDEDYKSFLLQHNGGIPEVNIFDISDKNQSGVNSFIPLSELVSENSKVLDTPSWAIPIAWAEGGNYVMLSLKGDGQVIFWDHELPEEITTLADSFAEFILSLKPFDINSVELKEGQVKKAWIDPDFLKGLK